MDSLGKRDPRAMQDARATAVRPLCEWCRSGAAKRYVAMYLCGTPAPLTSSLREQSNEQLPGDDGHERGFPRARKYRVWMMELSAR